MGQDGEDWEDGKLAEEHCGCDKCLPIAHVYNADAFSPVIVSTNSARAAVNFEVTRQCGKYMRDDQCEGFPPLLEICVGMPVMVTFNVAVKLGIANGTLAHVVHIQYPAGTVFNKERLQTDSAVEVWRAVPELIVLEPMLVKCPATFPGIPEGLFPLLPRKSAIAGKPSSKARFKTKVKQFPLTPAFALTVHKVQGLTLERVVLGDWRGGRHNRFSGTGLYVATSRVATREGLTTLFPMEGDSMERWWYTGPCCDVLSNFSAVLYANYSGLPYAGLSRFRVIYPAVPRRAEMSRETRGKGREREGKVTELGLIGAVDCIDRVMWLKKQNKMCEVESIRTCFSLVRLLDCTKLCSTLFFRRIFSSHFFSSLSLLWLAEVSCNPVYQLYTRVQC